MRSISNLIRAIANLASSINGLASLIDAATGLLRMQLTLDEASTVPEHQPAGGENVALDGSTNGTPKSRKAKAGAV
jgi:hypothetical protein